LAASQRTAKITGHCFQKYAETLGDRILDESPVDIESSLQQVEAGIDHLHNLNLIHNNIHAGNVMFKALDDKAVELIDFDSCGIQGNPLPGKQRHMPDGVCTAEFDIMALGLRMLCESLGQE
jgi:serine/threonine protein kinase